VANFASLPTKLAASNVSRSTVGALVPWLNEPANDRYVSRSAGQTRVPPRLVPERTDDGIVAKLSGVDHPAQFPWNELIRTLFSVAVREHPLRHLRGGSEDRHDDELGDAVDRVALPDDRRNRNDSRRDKSR